MADKIIGIAVLDLRPCTLEWAMTHFLHVACLCGNLDAKIRYTHIPVLPVGSPKTRTHQWFYRIAHPAPIGEVGRLDVHPSLNWLNVFHNDAQWDVLYVEYDHDKWGSPTLALKGVNPGTTFTED
jgi:hypothetical protein